MSNSRLVYTTAGSGNCPGCHKPLKKCRCRIAAMPNVPIKEQIIRIGKETKGRKGKGVTLVSGLQIDEKELKALSKQLKTLCGCGGTVKDGVIEIQGEHRGKIKQHLDGLFKQVKLAGG